MCICAYLQISFFFLSWREKKGKKERKNLCVEFLRICIEVTCMYFKLKCEIRKRIISKFILKPSCHVLFAMHLLQCTFYINFLKSFSKPGMHNIRPAGQMWPFEGPPNLLLLLIICLKALIQFKITHLIIFLILYVIRMIFYKFYEICVWNYDFQQYEKSMAALRISSVAHQRAAAQRLTNTVLKD